MIYLKKSPRHGLGDLPILKRCLFSDHYCLRYSAEADGKGFGFN